MDYHPEDDPPPDEPSCPEIDLEVTEVTAKRKREEVDEEEQHRKRRRKSIDELARIHEAIKNLNESDVWSEVKKACMSLNNKP